MRYRFLPRCMNCDCAIQQNELHCRSSLYGAPDGYLCKSCSDHEEDEIEKAGTNAIPKLVGWYKVKKEYFEPTEES